MALFILSGQTILKFVKYISGGGVMIDTGLAYLNSGRGEEMSDEKNQCILDTCQQTLRLTMELNNRYHTPEEIRMILS